MATVTSACCGGTSAGLWKPGAPGISDCVQGPGTCTIFCCFPRHISREQEWKWSSWCTSLVIFMCTVEWYSADLHIFILKNWKCLLKTTVLASLAWRCGRWYWVGYWVPRIHGCEVTVCVSEGFVCIGSFGKHTFFEVCTSWNLKRISSNWLISISNSFFFLQLVCFCVSLVIRIMQLHISASWWEFIKCTLILNVM